MHQRSRLFFFGISDTDRPFIEAVAAKLGLPLETRKSGIVYRALAHVPGLSASRLIQRVAQILSPWIEAIEISLFTRSTDLILIRNIRTGISYLTICAPFQSKRPRVVLTWFTMKQQPPAYWSAVYRRALLRAFRVFVFTPSERDTYAGWFGVPPSTFSLAVLEAPPIPPLPAGASSMKFDVIMTGETNRDWESFAAVCEQLPHVTFAAVMPAEQADKMPSLPNLRTFKRLAFAEYCQLISQSTIQLILVRDHGVAVGQRDFLLAGQLGVPVIATAVESLRIYDSSGDCAVFVEEGNITRILESLNRLLGDNSLRMRLSSSLKKRIEQTHSFTEVSAHWAANLGAEDKNLK